MYKNTTAKPQSVSQIVITHKHDPLCHNDFSISLLPITDYELSEC